jgi:hypothetical protein
MTRLFHDNQRLGVTADRDAVVVRVEISHDDAGRVCQTVDHAEIVSPVRLSLMGEVFPVDRNGNQRGGRRGEITAAGQIGDMLGEITEPAPGWTLAEIAEVAEIWTHWHLNDMRAGCNHLPADGLVREPDGYGGDRISTVANVCPVTGYRWGTAWLTDPLPDEIIARVRYLFRSRSADLYTARGYDAAGHPYPPPTA